MAARETFPRRIGRYTLDAAIASGGMASIHLGRLVDEVGFARTVAIKRMHPHYTTDEAFVAAFLDEARMCSRVRHTNVVPILDVVRDEGELFLVLEYLDSVSLLELLSGVHANAATTGESRRVPPAVVAGVLVGTLHGLHAAHEACGDDGSPLHIVHRDISPANILLGADGVARLIDFGVAKALGRISSTADGQLKGKLPYMSPEQVRGDTLDRRSDVFAAAVVLWEVLTHRRLFHGGDSGAIVKRILDLPIVPPSHIAPDLPPAVDDVVMRGLARDIDQRFRTAAEMADALEAALPPATARTIGLYVERVAEKALTKRRSALRRFESSSLETPAPSAPASERPSGAPRRKRSVAVAVLGGCAASALIAGGLVAWLGHAKDTKPVADTVSSPVGPASSLAAGPAAVPSAIPDVPAEPSVAAVASPATSSVARRVRPLAAASKPSAGAPAGSALPLYGRR